MYIARIVGMDSVGFVWVIKVLILELMMDQIAVIFNHVATMLKQKERLDNKIKRINYRWC